MKARHGRTVAPGTASTIHFALNQSYGGKPAGEHQLYIEREEACVVSFGNIAEEESERVRVWQEIEDRGGQRKGSIVIGADAPQGLREAAKRELASWRDEGRVAPALAGKMIRLGVEQWPEKGLRIWTHDDADHQRIAGWLREWEQAHESQAEPEEEDKTVEDSPIQESLPGFDNVAETEARAAAAEAERRRRELQRNAAKKRKLPRGCREFKPRRTLVQRRIVLELAHELSLAAQERALRKWCDQELAANGISYHAVIHQPESKNDVRNWHAHIVYVPITLERERTAEGGETGRFTFEAHHRLPPMPTLMRALGGNGPEGRRGAGNVVKSWRNALCDIQNRELTAVGSTKRYDPRSYEARGIDKTPGQHRGTKRAAMEASGRAADHWSAECPEWTQVLDEIDVELERIEATPNERNGVYETVEEVRLEMGAHAPEAEPPLREWGLRVRKAIREERTGEDPPAEGWRPAVHEIVDVIRATGRQCTVMTKPPAWQVAWRAAKRRLPDPLRLGVVADGIAKTFPGDVDGLAADPRPEARAVAARARRFRNERDQWIAAYEKALGGGPKGMMVFARRVVSTGLPIDAVLGVERAKPIRNYIEQAGVRREARDQLVEIANRVEGQSAEEMATTVAQIDWPAMQEVMGRGARRRRLALETAISVTALREAWHSACATGSEAVVALAQGQVSHPQWPAADRTAQARAWAALGDKERTLIDNAQDDPARAIATHARIEAKAKTVTNSLGQGPRTLDRLATEYWDLSEIKDYAPQAWQEIQRALRYHEKARAAMQRDLRKLGIEPDVDPGGAARRAAEIDNDTAVAVCLTYGPLILNDHEELWKRWWQHLRAWALARETVYSRGQMQPHEATQQEMTLLETIGKRLPGAIRLAVKLRQAQEARGLRRAHAERQVGGLLLSLAETGSNVEAARVRKSLTALLSQRTMREALGEERARAVARQAGLRDRPTPGGDPQQATTPDLGAIPQ